MNQKTGNNLEVWERFFPMDRSRDAYEQLRLECSFGAKHFLADIWDGRMALEDGLDPLSREPELDRWVSWPRSQNILLDLVCDLEGLCAASFDRLREYQTDSRKQIEPIAHDQWQMSKDKAEAIRFSEMEQPKGYKACMTIPTSYHDIGRIAEGWWGDICAHDEWHIPHAELSFVMLLEVLNKPDYNDIPLKLKQHFLYAVLAHSYRENGVTYMSRAVQACDRMQLIGPEGIIRAMSYMSAYVKDGGIGYPSNQYNSELPALGRIREALPYIEYFARCMPQNIGDKHQEWRQRIQHETLAMLMLYEGARSHVVLPKMVTNAQGERKLHCYSVDELQGAYRVLEGRDTLACPAGQADTVLRLIKEVERPSGAARLMPLSIERIQAAFDALGSNQKSALSDLVDFATTLRRNADQDDAKALERALTANPTSSHMGGVNAALALTASDYFEGTLASKPFVSLVQSPFPRRA